uniref:Uncharacterized protein n=1 Tax=Arundo donax TaxID=35708 RepID=A0A0A9CBN8_ARUDO
MVVLPTLPWRLTRMCRRRSTPRGNGVAASCTLHSRAWCPLSPISASPPRVFHLRRARLAAAGELVQSSEGHSIGARAQTSAPPGFRAGLRIQVQVAAQKKSIRGTKLSHGKIVTGK